MLFPCPHGVRLLFQLAAGRAEGLRYLLVPPKRRRAGCHLLVYGNCARADSLPQQQLLWWLFGGAAGRTLWSSTERFPDLIFIRKW